MPGSLGCASRWPIRQISVRKVDAPAILDKLLDKQISIATTSQAGLFPPVVWETDRSAGCAIRYKFHICTSNNLVLAYLREDHGRHHAQPDR
jgi:hypothetical protein